MSDHEPPQDAVPEDEARAHREKLLDEALAESFPASDPIAVTPDEPDAAP